MICGAVSYLLRLWLTEEFFVALGGTVGAYRSFASRAPAGLLGGADLTSRLSITSHGELLSAGSAYKERSATVQAVFVVTQGISPA